MLVAIQTDRRGPPLAVVGTFTCLDEAVKHLEAHGWEPRRGMVRNERNEDVPGEPNWHYWLKYQQPGSWSPEAEAHLFEVIAPDTGNDFIAHLRTFSGIDH